MEGEEDPDEWKLSEITPLHKKGCKTCAKNYRGISVGSLLSKVLSKVILERINLAYESMLSPNQYGFRKERSTTDAIFLLKNAEKSSIYPLSQHLLTLRQHTIGFQEKIYRELLNSEQVPPKS